MPTGDNRTLYGIFAASPDNPPNARVIDVASRPRARRRPPYAPRLGDLRRLTKLTIWYIFTCVPPPT